MLCFFSYSWYRFAFYFSSPSSDVIFLPLHVEKLLFLSLANFVGSLPKWYPLCRIFVMLLCSTPLPVISVKVSQAPLSHSHKSRHFDSAAVGFGEQQLNWPTSSSIKKPVRTNCQFQTSGSQPFLPPFLSHKHFKWCRLLLMQITNLLKLLAGNIKKL